MISPTVYPFSKICRVFAHVGAEFMVKLMDFSMKRGACVMDHVTNNVFDYTFGNNLRAQKSLHILFRGSEHKNPKNALDYTRLTLNWISKLKSNKIWCEFK